ncbi:hypothetical protein M9C81_03655 [SAR86 cluster bacterium]|nr:hypothetical protein M9C83_03745 [SAR86 cluster bacterium]URQ68874.1 hypothetical protein M9C81_03655 [SAR86 cluster bacterium]
MNSYINGILKFIRNNDKYHQIAMILSLLILLILLLFQLSKIQDNRKLLINAKSDFAYVEERFNLIANKISLNQLINNSENTNSLLTNIAKKYDLLNFQIYEENMQNVIQFDIDDLQKLEILINIFSNESFIQVKNIYINPDSKDYQIKINYVYGDAQRLDLKE